MRKTIQLPTAHEPYTDKYFLRANEILRQDRINPVVTYQVFVRKGPGVVSGLEEAAAMIEKFSPNFRKNGGRIFSLRDGDTYESAEPLMHITGRVQDLMELETIYLGVISAGTSLANGGKEPDLEEVEENARKIAGLADGRPVSYFGSRHWSWDLDPAISEASFRGGFVASSTDIGAEVLGQKGMGTIPHALILAYGSTVEAAKAFDRYIDPAVPRIVLIDTFNREISDSLECAEALGDRLYGVRIDTCGENVGEGGTSHPAGKDPSYQTGTGVTIESARNMREALDKAGYNGVKIILSSGFGNADKVKAFVDAEKRSGMRLFDSLGVGGLYDARFATSDIVLKQGKPCAKTGRGYRPNPRLVEV